MAAGDRIAQYSIAFSGDDTDFRTFLGNLKTQAGQTLSSIESAARKIDLFSGVSDQVGKANVALQTATSNVNVLTKAIESAKAAGAPTKELEAGLKSAQTELAATQRAYDRSVDSLTRLQTQLTKAGVDTRNLATESTRLAAAQTTLAAAQTDAAAKQVLGLKTVADVQPKINQAYAAYNTLIASGVLSVKERTQAEQQLATRVAEIRSQVTGATVAAQGGVGALNNFFNLPLVGALSLAAVGLKVVSFLKDSVQAAQDYKQGIAEIGAVSNLSTEQLATLGAGAKDLARDLGVGVNDALKGVFDLIRSGVPPDNALEVLRAAAEASKAGLTDLGTGVKAADLLLSGFGVTVRELPAALDKITQGAKDGGVTLKEFADNGGALVNVAKAANIPLDELVATLTLLRKSGLDAGEATSTLQKIIAKLDTSEARDKLRELGIEGEGLVDTFAKIGAKNLGLPQIIGDLGLASQKSAAGIATLTRNASLLPDELERIRSSAGVTAKAVADFYDTPKERAARFDAAFTNTKIVIGGVVGAESQFARAATAVLNVFNDLPVVLDKGTTAGTKFDNSVARAIASFFGVEPAATSAKAGIDAAGAAAASSGDKIALLAAQVQHAGEDLKDFGDKLLADVTALQQASARDVADADARANAQIAALDKSLAATQATAAATLAIQTKLAADRLAIIVKGDKDISAATDAAIASRLDAARKAGKTEQQIATDAAQLRITALGPVLAQYQAHYNALIAQAQGYAAKVQAIDQERVSFNEGIEKRLFDIRVSGLSAFDQYVAKVQETERLIALARQAGADGQLEVAKKYTEQAIALSDTIKGAVSANGAVIISDFDAQQKKIDLTKQAADAYNKALDTSDDAAKKGAAATAQALDDVKGRLTNLQEQYDALKKTIADGLLIKVALDTNSVQSALATLNDLTKPRTVQITTVVSGGGSSGPSQEFVEPTLPGLNRGGFVPGFADGGGVFRRPGYDKVPGFGDGDTVPALLEAGSFVMRKRAVATYGDARMSRIVQAYAAGGNVFFNPSSTPATNFFGSQGTYFGGQPIVVSPTATDPSNGGLPTDFNAKVRVILRYVDDVQTAARSVDGLFYWQPSIDALQGALRSFARAPTDDGIMRVLTLARGIGLNLGISKGEKDGFDVDGQAFHKDFGASPVVNSLQSSPLGAVYEFYRAGGGVGDTVPAMLTPGEFLVSKPAVDAVSRMFGGGFLDAVNQSRVSPATLDRLINLPAPTRPRGYASGGYVDDVRPSVAARTGGGGGGDTYNIHSNLPLDEHFVTRVIVPALRNIKRKNGGDL